MGPEFEPVRIEYSPLGKAEAKTSREPGFGSIEQLIAENERLQLLIVELLIKNEHLRTRLQDEKAIGSIEMVVRRSAREFYFT